MSSSHLTLESMRRMVAASGAPKSGSMIALIPREEDVAALAVPGFEPADELHVTLMFLGDAEQWSTHARAQLTAQASSLANLSDPVTGKLWATALFNPTGPEPCAVYLVGGRDLATIHGEANWRFTEYADVPEQHVPWVPHLTIGYNLPTERLHLAGVDITFDRVRVAFGGEHTDFPL